MMSNPDVNTVLETADWCLILCREMKRSMYKLMLQLVFGVWLAHFGFSASGVPIAHAPLTLSRVEIIGTTRLSNEDVAAGLNLRVGKETTRDELARACDHFDQMKLFNSASCAFDIRGATASLSISVNEMSRGWPVVFQNFVWMTRSQLLARLKQDIPLFMPELPEETGLKGEIIRVLELVASERGIHAKVEYDGFWAIRGMNDFYIDGISTPVVSLQIEGENAPSLEETQQWSKILYKNEDYSAPRLTWVIRSLIRDFYFARGYMRPVVGQPRLEYLGEKDGAYPVRIVVPIVSGDVFRFESVKFEGLAEPHSSELLAKWKLSPGDPYNESYKDKFIFDEILTQPWAQKSSGESRSTSPCGLINEATMTVSVTIGVEAPDMWSKIKPGQQCAGLYSSLVSPAVP
jgi:outer membrane protein assembly factor BamA